LEKTKVSRLGIVGKGTYEFFSSVILIDVSWLPANICENSTYSIWKGRKLEGRENYTKFPELKGL